MGGRPLLGDQTPALRRGIAREFSDLPPEHRLFPLGPAGIVIGFVRARARAPQHVVSGYVVMVPSVGGIPERAVDPREVLVRPTQQRRVSRKAVELGEPHCAPDVLVGPLSAILESREVRIDRAHEPKSPAHAAAIGGAGTSRQGVGGAVPQVPVSERGHFIHPGHEGGVSCCAGPFAGRP
jgi:hypothetical protein